MILQILTVGIRVALFTIDVAFYEERYDWCLCLLVFPNVRVS
jgi:hypothetical protein